MGEITPVSKASSKFESLRTTVPKSVVNQWQLHEGDELDWMWEARQNGELVIILRKARHSDTQPWNKKRSIRRREREVKNIEKL